METVRIIVVMKRILLYLLLALMCFFVLGVVMRRRYIAELYCIEKLPDDHSSQAIAKLEQINAGNLPEEELALYALLLTKNRYNQDPLSLSDSLIDMAIGYYARSDDSVRLSQSYCYKGKFFALKKYWLEAAECYEKAVSCAPDNNLEAKYRLSCTIGEIYHAKMIRKDEKEAKDAALHYALLLNDSSRIGGALVAMADYYRAVDDVGNNIGLLQKAIAVIPRADASVRAGVNAKLGRNYLRNGQFADALACVDRAICLETDSPPNYNYCNLKASVFAKLSQKDSALHYFNRSLRCNDFRTRMSTYRDLYQLEEQQGNNKEALTYLTYYVAIRDSFDLSRKERVADYMSNIQAYKRQKENARNTALQLERKRVVFYRILSIAFIVILTLTLVSVKIQKRKKHLESAVKLEAEKSMRALLMQKEIEYKLLAEQEERKRTEVRQLNLTIEYFKRLNAITVPLLVKCRNDQGAMNLSREEWDIIMKNADACFDRFTQRLKKGYPLLTEDELRFCCLVKMEMSIALLSEIYHIAKGSISRRKMRLREKMNIENSSFDAFIKMF